MSSSSDASDGLLNPPASDAGSPTTTRRDIARARQMSLSQVAAALDRDRNTISKWLEHGCPAVERADRATGKAWILDLAEVVRWLERRSAEAAAEKVGAGPDGTVPEAEAKRRRAVANAITAEAEAVEVLRTMTRWSIIIDRVTDDYSELRSRLSGIGDTVAGQVDRKIAVRVKELVDTQIAIALAALRVDQQLPSSSGT